MKYRVLRYFEGEETYILIGHFGLKMKASMAVYEDRMRHKEHADDLKYLIELVDRELTQAEIDVLMREARSKN